jgi:hypothetical protein
MVNPILRRQRSTPAECQAPPGYGQLDRISKSRVRAATAMVAAARNLRLMIIDVAQVCSA